VIKFWRLDTLGAEQCE